MKKMSGITLVVVIFSFICVGANAMGRRPKTAAQKLTGSEAQESQNQKQEAAKPQTWQEKEQIINEATRKQQATDSGFGVSMSMSAGTQISAPAGSIESLVKEAESATNDDVKYEKTEKIINLAPRSKEELTKYIELTQNQTDGQIKEAVVKAIEKTDNPALAEVFAENINDNDKDIKIVSIGKVGEFKHQQAVPALETILTGKEDDLKIYAADSLKEITGKDYTYTTADDDDTNWEPEVIIQAKFGSSEGELGCRSVVESGPEGPNAIATDKDGNIFILDPVNKRIVKYDKNGNYLRLIKLDQKKVKHKSPPTRAFEQTLEGGYKWIEKKPDTEYVDVDAISFYDRMEIAISREGNIYFRAGTPQFRESYVVVVYDKNGKIIRGFTNEDVGGYAYNMKIDDYGNLYFRSGVAIKNGKREKEYTFRIDREGKIERNELDSLSLKDKITKYDFGRIEKRFKKNFNSIPKKIEYIINKMRESGNQLPSIDREGNIYELIWDENDSQEGVKVIKWRKVK